MTKPIKPRMPVPSHMAFLEDGIRRYQVILAAVFLIACIGYLVAVYLGNIETEVMRDRFWKNADPLFNGEIPVMEYPPFALVFMAIPRLFADTPWGYNIAYVAEVFVFMVVGMLLVSKLAERFSYDQRKAMLAYSVLMLLMLEFVLDRFDIFPAILALAAFYLFATNRVGASCVLLAVGTMTKLYPALLFPPILVYLLICRRWRDAAAGTVCMAVTMAVIAAVAWLLDPGMLTGFMGYHEDRPLQIESVPASIVYLLSMFGLTDVWIQPFADPGSFGSDNLRGDLADAVAGWMLPLMVVAILVAYAAYAIIMNRDRADEGLRKTGLIILLAIMAFMVVNKVFSSQYIIWAIAPIVFLMMVSEERFSKRLFMSAVVMIVLTQVNFAYNIGYLGGGANIDDIGMVVLMLRNLVAVYIIWISAAELVGRSGADRNRLPGLRRIVFSKGME